MHGPFEQLDEFFKYSVQTSIWMMRRPQRNLAQICTLLNDIWTQNQSYAEAHQYAPAPGCATSTLTALKAQDTHAPQALIVKPPTPQYMPQTFPKVIQMSPTLIPGARSQTKRYHSPALRDAQDQVHHDLDYDLRKRFQQKCSRLKFSPALQT